MAEDRGMPVLDRRSSPRVDVEVGVELARPIGPPVAGRTVDLSVGGMRIQTARPLRVDEVLEFSLDLGDGRELRGDARVMRMHPCSRYALRFERLAPEAGAAVGDLVAGSA